MNLNSFNLTNKVALITGGSSGIGKMIALALLKAGAKVWIVSRNDAYATTKFLGDFGDIKHYKTDVTNTHDLNAMVNFMYQDSHNIDILVNAAGVNFRKPSEQMTLDIWNKTLKLNLTIPYYLSQLLAKKMMINNWGRIVNIASLQSYRAFADSIAYGASKGGVVQLTRALAEEYSRYGILVNAIAPGFFHTNLTKSLFENKNIVKNLADKTMMARNGSSDDLFGISVFLCSAANSYITGQTIALDGGFSAK